MATARCQRCCGEVVQKPRVRLVFVGLLMLAAVGLGLLWAPLWVPGLVLGVTGAYLLAWASVGRGRWCRDCKRFDGV
jgi:Flp pilus assembly protein TadB